MIAWMVWVPCWCDGDFVDESCGGQKVSKVRTCGVHSSSDFRNGGIGRNQLTYLHLPKSCSSRNN